MPPFAVGKNRILPAMFSPSMASPHGVEHRDPLYLLALFARRHPCHDVCPELYHVPGPEASFLPRDPLHQHPGLRIYDDAHAFAPSAFASSMACSTAASVSCNASS